MNEHLEKILHLVDTSLEKSDEFVTSIKDAVKAADHDLTVAEFKLQRTEKIKRTTAVFLDETIEELEKKRQAVEEQGKIIQAENERKTAELEQARQLQLAMLPKELPDTEHLEIAVYMSTCTEVGGDYYDFNPDSNGALTVAIGDATGHGLKAGMMVTATKSLFKSLASAMQPAAFLRQANRTIKQMNLGTLKMALTVLKIDNWRLTASGAGMPPMLIYRHKTKKLEEINFKSMPLGSIASFPYKDRQFELIAGDKILVMSDGYAERQNPSGDMLDYARAYHTFIEAATRSPQEIIEHLVQKGFEWAQGHAQGDDVTFVVIEIR
jgi:serine phosphatase RsbU (regulator of sigma subunit)